jgi:hypothetical protein
VVASLDNYLAVPMEIQLVAVKETQTADWLDYRMDDMMVELMVVKLVGK